VTDYERLGGADGVARIMERFVDRVFSDFIIGFLFEGRDRDRILRHEIELATAHLGGPPRYTGRAMGAVHRPLRIHRGHFQRRIAILRQVLDELAVPDDVRARWIAHDESLEPVIAEPFDCRPPG
jgi:hemoglobin